MQMLQARASSIKSGWKPLVGVFRLAAQEPHGALPASANRPVPSRHPRPPWACPLTLSPYLVRFGHQPT